LADDWGLDKSIVWPFYRVIIGQDYAESGLNLKYHRRSALMAFYCHIYWPFSDRKELDLDVRALEYRISRVQSAQWEDFHFGWCNIILPN
jgi:hypothetical protein